MYFVRAFALALLLVYGASASAEASDLIGRMQVHTVSPEETLLEIARRYDLGFVELRTANPGLDAWIPEPGTNVILPSRHVLPDTPRTGIVINLAEQRLYYFPSKGGPPLTFPVGIGKTNWETPLGRTKIVGKRENPVWTPPASICAERPDLPARVPPGPSNPLGAFALDLEWEGFVIHGTNRPAGVGRRVSHGCIRLYPEDIAQLFPLVRLGTPVTVVDQPIKLGWSGGALYLEAHPSQSQADEIEADGRFTPEPTPYIAWRIVKATEGMTIAVDWPTIDQTIAERRGIPVRIDR